MTASAELVPGRLLTYREAADFLSISERSLGSLFRDGKIASVRPTPGSVRFSIDDLRAYAESQRQPAEVQRAAS